MKVQGQCHCGEVKVGEAEVGPGARIEVSATASTARR